MNFAEFSGTKNEKTFFSNIAWTNNLNRFDKETTTIPQNLKIYYDSETKNEIK